MLSPSEMDEDEAEEEVEFVSEGPIRPVLECINLLSDSEEEAGTRTTDAIEDEVNRQKAQVTSTLERLARQVAEGKKEKADKFRAFKEKQISQRTHGQQEIALSSENGNSEDAKRCVDMWLKMPGIRPGGTTAGSNGRHGHTSYRSNMSTSLTCPVLNCGRVYDNVHLLEGHLKRFDHSPCDPTINLKGGPSERFACVACGQHFDTEEAWRVHVQSKVFSPSAEGHTISQPCQLIVCFACPACYLLFNIRDECLQHMSAKNHFTQSFPMNATSGRALPIPIPQHAKNHLVTLCKDVHFSVYCSMCYKVLNSHQVAQAHFNVYCKQGCAVAKANKTVAQVMKQLQVWGQCFLCCKIFFSQDEIERHRGSTQHDVAVNETMQIAILQYCRFSEIQHGKRAKKRPEKRLSTDPDTSHHRSMKKKESAEFPDKRQRLRPSENSCVSSACDLVLAWFCECGLRFSEEAAASNHLLAVNQIFHQCGVCGKLMGESSIARLHMSRFHGGAHLSNLLYRCRLCKVDMPRYEDILSHVSEAHTGHTYFVEREVPEELNAVSDAKPSTSGSLNLHANSKSTVQPTTAGVPAAKSKPNWMCRICEDLFDSEAAVHRHCSDVTSHSFQRFVCCHCPQKFFKASTVHRHCMNEHSGQIKMSHFCGLCDSMPFDSEGEFLEHYERLHSKDYYCMDDDARPAVPYVPGQVERMCPCNGSEICKDERKAIYKKCMKNLAAEGKCQYVCAPCGVTVSSFAKIKTHVHMTHTALELKKTFDVECGVCQGSFMDVNSFHKHYHSQHCPLEPCFSSHAGGSGEAAESTAAKTPNAAETKPDLNEINGGKLDKFLSPVKAVKDTGAHEDESDEEMKHSLALSAEAKESKDLEEALRRSLLDF
ncbi:E3 SUMO-protein ligase ZNF451 [Lampris incognitus]|uniref:E3 SUMO-protein ligase ZNF451 n=1 Tax=Lampris incognitus TaxID=2546036 RepID=UPI0024B4B58E|nr:E3 SUMO-protein ligase ZNF451 [Lampris incognitus]